MIDAAAEGAHAGDDGLGGEELRAEVDVLGEVPVVEGDLGHGLAAVVGGVVDENADGAEA